MSDQLFRKAASLLKRVPALEREAIEARLQDSGHDIREIRSLLKQAWDFLDGEFLKNADIHTLVCARALFMDRLLASLWNAYGWSHRSDVSLLAVGGYGRGELHPYSDIDLLILAETAFSEEDNKKIADFVTRLWDLKLDIGQSSRTIDQCIELAKTDITIATNLLETRTIAGNDALRQKLSERAYSDEVMTDRAFFLAKREEQRQRHEKYGDTEYNLEPNVKSSPGSLRDIQTVGWITKRHAGFAHSGDEHWRYRFLSDEEFQILSNGESFLWRIRYGLQMLAKRNENRLLFDYQRKLAPLLGFDDKDEQLAVEAMMKKYYRTVLGLAEISDVVLQYFDEAILRPDDAEEISLNKRFVAKGRYIEARHHNVFSHSPYALMEIFLLLAQNSSIKGIRATTIRAIRSHRHLIDDAFRSNIANTTLFMEILRTPHELHRTLSFMKRYNVLGKYLPEFGKIIGQMQHDLFHVYTVDAHTLRVIRNLVNFQKPENQDQFPLASRLIKRLPKLELVYIAGLYHDIAKGRGGDHSELGASDARAFCRRHHLSERDTQLVGWLVENHLFMSMTAQRKDTQDPQVIHDFAAAVPSQVHLDYLYVLTVADIAATNPKLWNTWRATLLQQLYFEARRAIRRGVENPIDRDEWINATKMEARYLLNQRNISDENIDKVWRKLGEDYFLQDSTNDIAWQTEALVNHGDSEEPLILIRDIGLGEKKGATQIVLALHSDFSAFAATTAVLEQLHLNIVEARVNSITNNFSLSSFIVLDEQNKPICGDQERMARIRKRLYEELDDPADYPAIIKRRTPRHLKLFSFPTVVTFSNDTQHQRTIMEVITPDRPGLLAKIGRAMFDHGLSLVSARIATLGERVEDVFCITDNYGQPISDADVCASLKQEICELLDEDNQA